MSYELKKAEGRLDNIRSVKPILAALRTISLGSWQMARNRRSGLSGYTDRLLSLLPLIVPHLVDRHHRLRRGSGRSHRADDRPERAVVVVLGSERGLCGRYNKALLDELTRYLDDVGPDAAVELGALGSRLVRELRQEGHTPTWEEALSITALPSYDTAYDLAADWLRQFETFDLDHVDVIYNVDQGAGTYAPTTVRLIPPALPSTQRTSEDSISSRMAPQPIIETDPMRLYVRVVEQWTAIAFYRFLLEAAATEHLARFQLMESATQNADDLMVELMMTVNSARRQAITREMQELAVSAGLLGK